MKKALFLLCVLVVSFAYIDPPMDEVMGHNFEIGFLNGLKDQLAGGPEPYFNATLIGVFPSVEDRVPADAGIYKVLWTWGEGRSDPLFFPGPIQGNEGCVDADGGDYPLESVEYSFKIKVGNETINWTGDEPGEIAYFNISLDAARMERYNATEKMEVVLEYNATYHYVEDHPGDCIYRQDVERGGTSNLSYYVENGNVTFFTVRPVLGEQWYRNNHFDNLVFSKKRIYKSEAYLDGVKVGEAHILNFSIYAGAGGAWFINSSRESNYANSTLDEFEIVYAPIPMIHNNESFRYLYEENYSYSGIGRHNLTLVLTDDFGRNHTYSRELLSRAAGGQEAAEEGAYYAGGGTEYARPTYEKPEQQLTHVIVPTGAIAVIFLVVLASTWWGMTGARKL